MIPWLATECIDVKELRRDVRAVVVPLIGPIDGAGVHDGDGGGSESMMYDDLCLPSFWEGALLLGVCVPLACCEKSSNDDFVLSARVSKTLLLMLDDC
jgi:hypothetical protein